MAMKKLAGMDLRKLQPKLRMIMDGSSEVNAVRAELASSIAVVPSSTLARQQPVFSATARALESSSELGAMDKTPQLEGLAEDILINVFVETADLGDESAVLPTHLLLDLAQKANVATGSLLLTDLPELVRHPQVTHVELGQPLAAPTPEVSLGKAGEPPYQVIHALDAEQRGGAGVLIGIIDVQGFDFSHPEFLDEEGKTRFVRIWDQGGDARPRPDEIPPFNYGAEFKQDDLNAALAAAADVRVPPYELEPQSQMEPGSHGTHVASIAAGKHGVCPDALIAAVLISLPEDHTDRRRSFYDSTRIAHAVDYLFRVAAEEGKARNADGSPMPISINISLGTNGHAHDASAAVNRWIDSALAVPGRSVCVAAGNAGQEVAAFEGDTGYVMGRIHTSGQLRARGLVHDIDWLVVGNGIVDVSENELELWYGPQDRFAVSVRPPGGDWIGPIKPQEYVENRRLSNGTFVSIYNELYHPSNGSNYIAIYLSPFFSPDGVAGVPSGKWMIRLTGLDVRDGNFHGWIERDDPRRLGRVGARDTWRFPSFFSERSNVDNTSVSSLACGQRIVAVANLDTSSERISITSSQGPTREGRSKPDVAAPGTNIVAARGFSDAEDPWIKMSGTSMASPYVAGVIGLMFALEPKLTAAQIEGILHRTSDPLPGVEFSWQSDAGFGRIMPELCIAEAANVNEREEKRL